MKTTLLIWLAAVFVASTAISAPLVTAAPSVKGTRPQAEPIPLELNMEYPKARAALMKQGWKPVITSFKNPDGEPLKSFFASKIFVKLGWVEVEYCLGFSQDLCFFNFSKNHHCLKIVTEDEYIAAEHQFPRVMSWRRECPSKDD